MTGVSCMCDGGDGSWVGAGVDVEAAAAWGPQLLPQRSPGDAGKSLAALRGPQSLTLRGPGTGEGAEPPRSSRWGSVKTNSPVTGNKGGLVWFEPSWTLPIPVACLGQRHRSVPKFPVLQGAPGAPELAVSRCRAAPSTLLGSLLRMDLSRAGIVTARPQRRENRFAPALW